MQCSPDEPPDHKTVCRAHLGREALLVDHLGAHGGPGLLVQLVDGGADRAELGGRHAAQPHRRVQQPPMIQLDAEVADVQLCQDLDDYLSRQHMHQSPVVELDAG